MYLRKSKVNFKKYVGILINKPKPCSPEEIEFLEEKLNCALPGAYKEFLQWMGHGAGMFLAGTDIFYEYILKIQAWAKESLVETNFPKPLPDDAVVFMMHQGYQFMFFRTSDGENPPIYYYHEAYHFDSFELKYPNLDEFLLAIIDTDFR